MHIWKMFGGDNGISLTHIRKRTGIKSLLMVKKGTTEAVRLEEYASIGAWQDLVILYEYTHGVNPYVADLAYKSLAKRFPEDSNALTEKLKEVQS